MGITGFSLQDLPAHFQRCFTSDHLRTSQRATAAERFSSMGLQGYAGVVSREMCKLIRGLLTYVIDYPSHTEDRALRGRTPSAV